MTLYEEMEALDNEIDIEIDNGADELYVLVTAETAAILVRAISEKRWPDKYSTFIHNGKMRFAIPCAYDPYWETQGFPPVREW
jgi:hypothetical protein